MSVLFTCKFHQKLSCSITGSRLVSENLLKFIADKNLIILDSCDMLETQRSARVASAAKQKQFIQSQQNIVFISKDVYRLYAVPGETGVKLKSNLN